MVCEFTTACVYVLMYVHMHINMCVCMYICMYPGCWRCTPLVSHKTCARRHGRLKTAGRLERGLQRAHISNMSVPSVAPAFNTILFVPYTILHSTCQLKQNISCFYLYTTYIVLFVLLLCSESYC